VNLNDELQRRSDPGPWRDRNKQQRCSLCGRFAYWDERYQEWRLRCVYWDWCMGGYEHE